MKRALRTKQLNIRIPPHLYEYLAILSIKSGLTITEIVEQYIRWLKCQDQRGNNIIKHEWQNHDFKLVNENT